MCVSPALTTCTAHRSAWASFPFQMVTELRCRRYKKQEKRVLPFCFRGTRGTVNAPEPNFARLAGAELASVAHAIAIATRSQPEFTTTQHDHSPLARTVTYVRTWTVPHEQGALAQDTVAIEWCSPAHSTGIQCQSRGLFFTASHPRP